MDDESLYDPGPHLSRQHSEVQNHMTGYNVTIILTSYAIYEYAGKYSYLQ
jgi:heme/copper-type cytochrome/quinol oxidase subunit 4